jgi:SAM-dependent methyltransferase
MPISTKEDKYGRTIEQLRKHYEVEKELACQLRNSTKEERRQLYTALYDQLYSKIPDVPKLTRKADPIATAWVISQRMQLLKHFLKPDTVYLELGPGDCSLSLEVTKHVKQVYAVDVSTELTKNLPTPSNFELIISDGCSVPAPANSVTVAYSHQLMEHLHPNDAAEQLQNLYHALAPDGVYICITPNRLSGPHDISRYFDETATGFHLKEYTVIELYDLFRQVGFSRVNLYKSYKQSYLSIPLNPLTGALFQAVEGALSILPFSLRRKIASLPLLFRGMTIVGIK